MADLSGLSHAGRRACRSSTTTATACVTDDLDRAGFEALISEGGAPAPGLTNFDTPVGHGDPAALRAGAGAAGARGRRGVRRAPGRARRRGGQPAVPARRPGPRRSASTPASGAGRARRRRPSWPRWPGSGTAHEIVRLEAVAEAVAADGVEPDGLADAVAARLSAALAAGAVGFKTVAAYRIGLDVDPAPPPAAEVTAAAAAWLAAGPGPGGWRLADPRADPHAARAGRRPRAADPGARRVRRRRHPHAPGGPVAAHRLAAHAPGAGDAAALLAVPPAGGVPGGGAPARVPRPRADDDVRRPAARPRCSRRRWRSRRSASCSTPPTRSAPRSSTTSARSRSGARSARRWARGWRPASGRRRTPSGSRRSSAGATRAGCTGWLHPAGVTADRADAP